MNYKEALDLKNKNLHIIGLEYNGKTIDELIIHPSNEEEFEKFIEIYLENFDNKESLLSFIENDLEVSVIIDRENTWENGLIFKTSLENIGKKEYKLNL